MTRAQTINWLVTNCDCWKKKQETLNKLSDDELKLLVGNSQKVQKAELVANAANEILEDAGYKFDEQEGEFVLVDNDDDEEDTLEPDDDDDDEDDAPAQNRKVKNGFGKKKGKKPMKEEDMEENEETEEQNCDMGGPGKKKKGMAMNQRWKSAKDWLSDPNSAPAEIKSAVTNAMKVERKEKLAIVRKLVANVAESKREAKAKELMAKSLDELEGLVELLPTANTQQERGVFDFFSQEEIDQLSLTDNSGDDQDEVEAMTVPTLNYAEMAKERRKLG